jgi:hypothetical protein
MINSGMSKLAISSMSRKREGHDGKNRLDVFDSLIQTEVVVEISLPISTLQTVMIVDTNIVNGDNLLLTNKGQELTGSNKAILSSN